MSRRALPLLCFVIGACGGGGETADGPVQEDAAAPTVVEVDPCPDQQPKIVTDLDERFKPDTLSITQGTVVRFEMDNEHDVKPNGAMSDPGLNVGLGQTKCLRFTATGTFRIRCQRHGFAGTITVN